MRPSMKNFLVLFVFLFICRLGASAITVDSIHFGKFGKIILYHPAKEPTSVALFVSGDGGWQHGVINMAKNIARQGALVLGIDAKTYNMALARSGAKCYYPAADFEQLSLMIQKKYKFRTYFKPVLIGYSYGATYVYGILAQAPANTFKGAIGIGFSPDMDSRKPLCKGSGLNYHVLKPGVSIYLERTKNLTAPFIVLNGVKDKSCPYAVTEAFLKDMPMTELVALPKVGHGFLASTGWFTQFNVAYKKILNAPSFNELKAAKSGLQISEVKTIMALPSDMALTVESAPQKNNLPLMMMISGDGGWTSFDQSLAESIARKGITVIGLDAQKYFWNAKTPDGVTSDISRVLVHYMQLFDKKTFMLAGYSFGASVVPFIAARLPQGLKGNLAGITVLSPDVTADFEIHISDMLSMGSDEDTYNVLAEVKKIKNLNPVCFFGAEEDQEVQHKFAALGIKVVSLPGNHHFNDDFSLIAESLYSSVKKM